MKKTILGICLMTFALAGCQKELVEPEAQTQLLGPVEFYAVLEEFTPGAKTSLNENRCVIWSEGDQLAIFQGSTLADKYQVKEGQAGGTNTIFSIVKNLGGNKDDDFSGGTEIPFDTNIAIYPFEDDLICNPIYEGEEITSYQIKNFTIPAVQTYAENSFAEEAFAMTAITNGLADHNLKFKNVCGALKLQLKGTATVKKIELKGNADEQIAGDAVVTVYADGTVPSIEMNPNATTVITLDCEGGVELNESSATTFMFAVPPTDFDTGFTATITATDGKVGELKTIKPNPVRRAAIKAMPEITPVMEIPPVNLSENGTANCYIVSAPGYYKFSPTQGNSQQLIKSIASAQVLWETFGTATRPNVGDLIQSVSFEDNAIFFYTAETYKEGNAVIAAKDASGTILWSWHIWFTDQPEEQVYPNNAGIMMDRNLGATSATPGEVEAYGLHYQWGRKDPFLGSNVLTYRDEYGSSIDDTQKAASTLTWPQAVYAEYTTVTIDYTIKKPTTRVIGDSSTYDDWMSDNPDQTRWKPTKTIYDPCPAGWRVPTGGSSGRDGFWANAGFENANYDSANFGFSFNLGSGLYAWYPLPGYYAYGHFDNPGYGGTYWSCTADGFDSYAMSISNYNESPTIKSYYEYDNHHAYSVRCFKEGSNTGAVVVPPATPKDGDYIDADGNNHGQGVTIDGTTWAPVNEGAISKTKYGNYYSWIAAHNACPDGWRLPTTSEFSSLAKNTTWATVDGVNGYWLSGSVSSTSSSKAIFMPAAGDRYGNIEAEYAGYYWTQQATKYTEPYTLQFTSGTSPKVSYISSTTQPLPVRCVRKTTTEIAQSEVTIDGLTWSTKNVGATKNYETGNYYTPDQASFVCPKGWRVPTFADMKALTQNHSAWTTLEGVNGYWFSGSKSASSTSNKIFLPKVDRRYESNDDGSRFDDDYGHYMLSQYIGNYYYYTFLFNDVVKKYSGFNDENATPVRCVKGEYNGPAIESNPTLKESEVEIDDLVWSSTNLGASSIESIGSLFTWDEANVSCPEGWRLPTDQEMKSLIQNYSIEFIDNQSGFLCTGSKTDAFNSPAVFLPNSDYWLSTFEQASSYNKHYLLYSYDYRVNVSWERDNTNQHAARCVKDIPKPEVPEEPEQPQKSYSVQLTSSTSTYGWVKSTSVSNPDASLYDGVYESTNGGKHSTKSIMYIDIKGYETFTIYVRSNAESSYDYVEVSNLDADITSSTSNIKTTTQGKQNSGTSLSSYTEVKFTNIDGGQHRIMVTYRKDVSVDSGDDKGYVLIPKNQ